MMGEVKNLHDIEDVATLKYLVEEIKICMFCTNLNIIPVSSRPMSVHQVDAEGNIWFISSKERNKNFESGNDNKVQLFFTSMADSHYLSVFGTATFFKEKEDIDQIWIPIANAWFEESINDSSVTVVKVAPTSVYYWDSKENKIALNLKSSTIPTTAISNEYAGVSAF